MSLATVPSATSEARLDELIARQEEVFLRRQPTSAALVARARHSLAGGATSNWQIASPQSVWLSHGVGGHIVDVDRMDYVDMHGGQRRSPVRPPPTPVLGAAPGS